MPPLRRGWAHLYSTVTHSDPRLRIHKALPQALLQMLLTRTLRGSDIRTILQAKTGIQPHPVALQSSCSDPVLCRQDRSPDPGSGVGAGGCFRSPSGVRTPEEHHVRRWGNVEVRHLVGAQKPEEGLSSHSFHGSEEPGLRLRSRAAMLPWRRRDPLSLTAGISVIGGWGWEEDVSLAAPRVGARMPVIPLLLSPFLSPPTPHHGGQQPAGGVVGVPGAPV